MEFTGNPASQPDYSRQMQLPGIGAMGQQRLSAARVLVVGAGGLGVPVLQYLAGAGVGTLGIVDDDVLEASNLHRQPLYTPADCGHPKAALAAARLHKLNPAVTLHAHEVQLNEANAATLLADYDLAVDCTDNFRTKYALNDACLDLGRIGVLASVYEHEGYLQVIRPGGACLRCAWPRPPRDGLMVNGRLTGMLGPVPAVLGSLQALETLKLLLDLPGALCEEVLVVDLVHLNSMRVAARRSPDCAWSHGRQAGDAPQPPDLEISFDNLAAAQRAGFTLIDIREDWERRALPASGALALDVTALLEQADANRDQPLLIVCTAGVRSLATAQLLHGRGLRHVRSLRGGFSGLQS